MKIFAFKSAAMGALVAATMLAAAPYAAAQVKFVGGAPMYNTKNIVENAVNSRVHTTLVAAVKAAGLVDTLASPGPFTVFAPVNSGFAALPAGTVDTLLKPANKGQLVKVLTAHVVPGNISAAEIRKRIRANGGSYAMQTASGDTVTASMFGLAIRLTDENGGTSLITQPDINQSNGVIHVVNNVLVPK